MSERIEVGDLVVVVCWPCCGDQLGHIGRVMEITTFRQRGITNAYCGTCGSQHVIGTNFPVAYLDSTRIPAVSWLKRIPPLSELESTERKEEIPA